MNNYRGWLIALAVLLLLVGCCCCALAWAAGSAMIGGLRAGVAALEPDGGLWPAWLRGWDGDWRAWAESWNSGLAQARAPITQTLTVQGPATLDVRAPVGEIVVQAGEPGRITIDGTKRAFGATQAAAERRLADVEVKLDQAGDRMWVRVSGPAASGKIGQTPHVVLTITVPPQTTVTADLGVGRLQIAGVTADVTVNAEVGDVILTDVTPITRLTVKTRISGVDFTGALVPGARYTLTTDVGKIALRLPAESAFRLDARSDIGDVAVGFPLTGRSSRDALVGKEVRGQVGQSPTASLYLRARVGEISLKPSR